MEILLAITQVVAEAVTALGITVLAVCAIISLANKRG